MVSGFDFRRRQNGIGLTLSLSSFALVIFAYYQILAFHHAHRINNNPSIAWAPIMQASLEAVKQMLHSLGHETKDFGAFSEDSVDYRIGASGRSSRQKLCDLGVVFGGSGNGEAMAANKIKGVRCALCWNLETAKLAKEHNDANVISIGQRQVSLQLTLEIAKTWINATLKREDIYAESVCQVVQVQFHLKVY